MIGSAIGSDTLSLKPSFNQYASNANLGAVGRVPCKQNPKSIKRYLLIDKYTVCMLRYQMIPALGR